MESRRQTRKMVITMETKMARVKHSQGLRPAVQHNSSSWQGQLLLSGMFTCVASAMLSRRMWFSTCHIGVMPVPPATMPARE